MSNKLLKLIKLDPFSRYERLIGRRNSLVGEMNDIAGLGNPSAYKSMYRRLEKKYEKICDRVMGLRTSYPTLREIQ